MWLKCLGLGDLIGKLKSISTSQCYNIVMTKTLVTHKNPDLDAITSLWLFIRFDQSHYGDAKLEFIPASTTYKNLPVDSDPDVVHVDVGFGRFDHHMPGGYTTCGSKLVYEHLVAQGIVSPSDIALKQMAEFALSIDRFEDSGWDEPLAIRYAFTLHEVIPSLHILQTMDNEAVTRYVFVYLDGVYQRLKQVIKAQEEIVSGTQFTWSKGKGLAILSGNSEVIKIAQKQGYSLVILKHPDYGHMRIKAVPEKNIDLTPLYDKIMKFDRPDQWFLHPSKQMLLNGSDKSSPKDPTTLGISEVVDLAKEVL